jgi:hypothetical protein
MRYGMRWPRKRLCREYWKPAVLVLLVLCVTGVVCPARAERFGSKVFVPYGDLVNLVEPADKAVLMDRAKFEELLAAAEANVQSADSLELGQVERAEYSGRISGDELTLTGELRVVSMSAKPVTVPLGFGRIGLTKVVLDDKPAPLGYDKNGRLTLIVSGKGGHRLLVEGTTRLTEIPSGGMQFNVSLPEAVAARMEISSPGDLEMHATAPVSRSSYDKQADRTDIELTIGGQDELTVVLLGNGRQEDERAILLGESASTVSLTRAHQVLGCLYTVQVLRRGVRELQFHLPGEWTITEVACPSLVKWSVVPASAPGGSQILGVRLRSAKVGTTALHISASAVREGKSWRAPKVLLAGAAFQRGYLMVDTDEGLGVRAEKLTDARRQDVSAAASVPGLAVGSTGLLYFHWSDDWSIGLELEPVSARRSIKERQVVVVSPSQVTVTGVFEVTAVDRELFDISFVLDELTRKWQVAAVEIDGRGTGFEYRIDEMGDYRLLKIELARPVSPEKLANVRIVLQHVPQDWSWPSDAPDRSISVPLIRSQGDNISGNVSISAVADLDAVPQKSPAELEAVPVGRMVSLGMQRDVQYAFSYTDAPKGDVELQVSRRRPRTSADSVGLVSVRPGQFTSDWRVIYTVSRASTKRLYLLADKSLGQQIRITSASVPISSKSILEPGDEPMPLAERLAQGYDLWLLNLDRPALGEVVVGIHFERPFATGAFSVPLVRPMCQGQISEQLAIQASEELALVVKATGAREIDAIDLPALPAPAARVLAAFMLDSPEAPAGPEAAVTLETSVNENYEIPSALALSAELTTYLDVTGGQRTEADFTVANAGQQFLTIRLPEGAELWSLKVAGCQARPQRSSGGDYQVALGRLGRPVPVRIVYAYRPGRVTLRNLNLGGVELPGVEMNRIDWNVVPPPGYQITTQETKMQTRDLQRPVPAYMQVYHFLRENIFAGGLLMPYSGGARRAREYADKGAEPAEALSVELDRSGPVDSNEAPKRPPAPAPTPAPRERVAQRGEPAEGDYFGVRLQAQGRYTLPVDLMPTPGAGPSARFTGLGGAELVVGLTSRASMLSWWAVGFVLVLAGGIALVGRKARAKAVLFLCVLACSSLLAVWRPGATHFANGVFVAGICLVPFYVLVCLVRWLLSKLRLGGAVNARPAMFVTLLAVVLCLGCSVRAADAAGPPVAPVAPAAVSQERPASYREPVPPPLPTHTPASEPLIVPYEGDPTTAEESQKVLIPYARFVKLWNQANPEDTIDVPRPGTDISLAAVQYEVTVGAERLELVLTANVTTYGRDWAVLAMPISGLAVTESTFGDEAAQLQAGPKGMVLLLPGQTSGRLRLKAVGRPDYIGQRGSISLSLPPLPGAVMHVTLPEEDLELEVDRIDGAVARSDTDGAILWTVPLGMTREMTLRWLPKPGGGAADRTLSAATTHDVYAFHWALVGVSKIKYSFSGGEHDRFAFLLPEGATLTDLKGTNVRDFREVGQRTVEGEQFRLIQVRLHRPAKKQYEMTVRWLGRLPALERTTGLVLLRAAEVGRESGTVTLHSAGGMSVKVVQVDGGRRADMQVGKQAVPEELPAGRAAPVSRYYWPYRPFTLSVRLSRLTPSPKVHLDQLVRISPDRVELLVQAKLTAERGRVFGASFLLPQGYELLSVVGPAVDKFYERSGQNGRFLHVKFHAGQQKTGVALVLVRRDVQLETFEVPQITYYDSQELPLPEQQGRLAVQVAASLEAQTAASSRLKAVTPQTLADWLDPAQINSVQFAYTYEIPGSVSGTGGPSLRLDIRRQPTRVQVEIFAGLVVRTTAAAYTYRLRYNVAGSPIDRLSFSLPAEYGSLVAVTSPAMRSVAQSDTGDGRATWTVSLVNEVTGLVDVGVNFALPIEKSTKLLKLPRIETDAPAGYQAVVAVQNMSRHDISVSERQNLAELGLSEQQKLISEPMRNSLQYVFRSFEDNWALSLNLTPAKEAERIQAVVDLLALTTVIDRSGRCRCEARIALQNRSEQFLGIDVPQGLWLWSAAVAGEPVKPVMPADAPAGRVLIPLVKTSPGGLPYDVYLYFADDGTRPLVAPLNGITQLKPPAISIVGIPVMRTTWSLRLPGGYRYMRPGGNMSRVVGTVEMLSLGIEARLEQLKRLEQSYRDVAGSSSQREGIARGNWDLFNANLAEEISQAQSYLDTNRWDISDDEYHRLKSTLGGQKQQQLTIFAGNASFVRKRQEQFSYDLNGFINSDISNPGVAEVTRNGVLLTKPDFLSRSEQQQIERLNRELQLSEKEKEVLQSRTLKAADMPEQVKLYVAHSRDADDLLVESEDAKASAVDEMLSDIALKGGAQLAEKQQQLRMQLDALGDNRMQRYYYDARMRTALGPRSEAEQEALAQAYQPPWAGQQVLLPQFGERAGGRYSGYGAAAKKDAGQDMVAGVAVGGRESKTETSASVSAVVTASGRPSVPQTVSLEPSLYVSKGIYSLPVALPEGEVRLDFARPSGGARLSIWAVPVGALHKVYCTLAVFAGVIVALGLVKLWPHGGARQPVSARRAVVYLLLIVAPALALGLVGLIVGVAAVLAAEAFRARFAAKSPTATAA